MAHSLPSSIESSPEELNLEHNISNNTDITAPTLSDDTSKLLETLEIDTELLKLISPTKHTKPKCLPATYFPSLRNHTSTHSRQSSSSAIELLQDEQVFDQKREFKVEQERKYSIYVSNDDYEIPETYQVPEISIDGMDPLKTPKKHRKGGSFGSFGKLFHKKSGSLSSPKLSLGHKSSRSTTSIDLKDH